MRFCPSLFASASATISLSRNEDEDPILRDSEAARYIHILLNKDILDVDRMRGNRAIPARSRRGISTPLGDKAGRAVSRADLPSVKLINPGILILCNSRTAWSNPSDRSSFGPGTRNVALMSNFGGRSVTSQIVFSKGARISIKESTRSLAPGFTSVVPRFTRELASQEHERSSGDHGKFVLIHRRKPTGIVYQPDSSTWNEKARMQIRPWSK